MMVSSHLFWGFVVFSLVAVWFFYRGVKLNVRRAREVAEVLEEALNPEDKLYTWLGGVIGFSADYKVDGFEKVQLNFRMVPRHVLFWVPINLLLRRKDNLQVLFFLKIPVSGEFHVVRRGYRPRIYNRERLYREEGMVGSIPVELLFDTRKPEKKVLSLVERVAGIFRHVALTPEKRVFYLSLDVEGPSQVGEALARVAGDLKGLRKL